MAAQLLHSDLSCAPIGDVITYERGDSQPVTVPVLQHITPLPPAAFERDPWSSRLSINPLAGIDVEKLPKPAVAPRQDAYIAKPDAMDHSSVGGRVTICVLFYGDYYDLHKKCLDAILTSVPAARRDLRVASNAACAATVAMLDAYVAAGVVTKHYRHTENAYKYPVMREMFFDPTCPISTKWVLWFDDDSICNVDPNWLAVLATSIAASHQSQNAHMLGAAFIWTPNERQRQLLQSRPWHKGRPWRDQAGKPSPTGNKIIFAVGGFWAITAEAIVAADIPDLGTGLTHTGGDWQIGEQLYQAGFGLKTFNGKKQFINTSSVPRRGVTMPTIDNVPRENQ